MLFSIGTVQWLVLGSPRTPSRTLDWGIAFLGPSPVAAFAAITTPLWQPGQPPQPRIGALIMASTVAAITGIVELQILDSTRSSTGSGPPAETTVT